MIRAVFALLLLIVAMPAAAQERVRVMTFNVRLPLASDGADDWPRRRALFVGTVAKAAPDVIGTQELHREQGDDVVAALPHYAWFGRDRRGGAKATSTDEHMGVFYRRDRLTLLASGDFWLSDTPDVAGSITWGNLYPRMATWGRFRTRAGRTFVLVDTHLPYRAEDERAREKGAALIVARLPTLAGRDPVVLTGDFNTAPDTPTHRILASALTDVRDTTGVRTRGPTATFHGFTGTPDRRIDWIFTRGLTVRSVATLTDHRGARYPSDHFPVVADLVIGPPEKDRGRRAGDQDRPRPDRPRG